MTYYTKYIPSQKDGYTLRLTIARDFHQENLILSIQEGIQETKNGYSTFEFALYDSRYKRIILAPMPRKNQKTIDKAIETVNNSIDNLTYDFN